MLQKCSCKILQGSFDCPVSSVEYHSGNVRPGSVFVCIEGTETDGHCYAEEAVKNGASAIVCRFPKRIGRYSGEIPVTIVQTDDCRKALALMASAFYGNPSKELSVIGVTGTKGKTTTSYMIRRILRQAGIPCGLVGTVEIDTGRRILESRHTTPQSSDLQKYLREMADSGCKVAVLEVSSQALMQKRVEGIDFDCGVFTNLEEDHIGPGEHADFYEYAYWKSRLFTRCRQAVVNGDDPHLDLILKDCHCPVTSYGFGRECRLRGYDFAHIRLPGKLGVEFRIKGDYNIDLVVGMAGKFSCYNAMAAVAVARQYCNDQKSVREALLNISVPGRQEMFGREGAVVMVDYAHNGTALRNLLSTLRQYEPRRLTCVFGCGGQRDRNRRFTMAEAAAEYADFIVVTSDNPRREPAEQIIDDITGVLKRKGADHTVIQDRREAIYYAVRCCIRGEIVVVAGKGHETCQLTGDEKIHFDDREEVCRAMEKVNHERNNTG